MKQPLDNKPDLNKHTVILDSEENIEGLAKYLKNLLKSSKKLLVTGVISGFTVYDKSKRKPNIRFRPTIEYAADSFKIRDLSMKPYAFVSILAIKDKEEK